LAAGSLADAQQVRQSGQDRPTHQTHLHRPRHLRRPHSLHTEHAALCRRQRAERVFHIELRSQRSLAAGVFHPSSRFSGTVRGRRRALSGCHNARRHPQISPIPQIWRGTRTFLKSVESVKSVAALAFKLNWFPQIPSAIARGRNRSLGRSAMARTWIFAVLATCVAVSPAAAQDIQYGWRFRWQPGQILYYRVDHHTNVSETVSGNKVETMSKLALIKRWEVTAVDPQGVATLKLSVTAMRHEQSRPNGG